VGVRHLVLRVVAVDQVLHDGAALKQADGRPVGEGVGQRGDAAVGVDLEEPGLLWAGRGGLANKVSHAQRVANVAWTS
jgi:hypothetical protein